MGSKDSLSPPQPTILYVIPVLFPFFQLTGQVVMVMVISQMMIVTRSGGDGDRSGGDGDRSSGDGDRCSGGSAGQVVMVTG